MKKILIAEDDEAIRDLLDIYIDKEKYEIVFASNGEEALQKFQMEKPDLILLDVNMPKISGIEVCKKIREHHTTPIIFVTGRRDSEDVVEGLMAGADDYVIKPFDNKVLAARIEANIRFKKIADEGDTLKIQNIELNFQKNKIQKDGRELQFHPREMNLLFYMAKNPDQVISSRKLYEEVWEADSLGDTLTVSVHISRIRKKIEDNPKEPKLIKTVKGRGYILLKE
ncbi:response regulator transcription factor [Evansella tamaricis]|uniref:Response regulator transcription factor n=1 Tax=Evansella tamaricis TaxID=2069301 RepID=A0ABS6JAE9_9BACI|nr:response regulator transcription factor [Evansella tamaricis]MBU9710654.1 response regulator transcription factor [Evansella tamaricis]